MHPAFILNPDASLRPKTSFSDVVLGPHNPAIPLKSVSLLHGEPYVIFSTEEIAIMVEPFKLVLVGKFSFGCPSMDIIRKFFISLDLKGNSQISLLDNRHILIKLSMEEDYSRIWVRQTWYANGQGMRIFKWSKDFRCSVESPIVTVWVSLPHLPVYFIHYKAALYSIVAAIGSPLQVDHATAYVNKPSIARMIFRSLCSPISGLEKRILDFDRILFLRRSLLIALYVGISSIVLRLVSSPTQGFAKPPVYNLSSAISARQGQATHALCRQASEDSSYYLAYHDI